MSSYLLMGAAKGGTKRRVLSFVFGLCSVGLAAACPSLARAQDAAQAKSLGIVPRSGPLANESVYTDSYAVIIGIDYDQLPKDLQLPAALNDANDLKDLLVSAYGFPADNVTLLLGQDASRHNIETALANLGSRKIKPTDRVLVFFSGHGQTIRTNEGGDMGFLIPADAQIDLHDPDDSVPYLRDCLPMDSIWHYLEACPARHRLLIADACFGGLLVQGKALPRERPNEGTLKGYLAIPALEAITAGRKGEEALVLPGLRNSAFTSKLLETLRQAGATPGEVVTASELGSLLKISVPNLIAAQAGGKRTQTPQFGSRGTEGEFLFISTVPRGGAAVTPVVSAPAKPVPPPVKATIVPSLRAPRTLAEYKAQMVRIPGGTFRMGSSDGDADEKPVHQVTLSPFRMGRTPVTVAMWKQYCQATGKRMPDPTPLWGWIDDHPIVNVSWIDAKAYCTWAHLTLPTEAQWEYAAKGGQDARYPWGDTFEPDKLVWYDNSGKQTAPVIRRDRLFVNRFGLVDMEGNVWQWCADRYGTYGSASVNNPTGPRGGDKRVLRGSSWGDYVVSVTGNFRTAGRGRDVPTDPGEDSTGFRCVLAGSQ